MPSRPEFPRHTLWFEFSIVARYVWPQNNVCKDRNSLFCIMLVQLQGFHYWQQYHVSLYTSRNNGKIRNSPEGANRCNVLSGQNTKTKYTHKLKSTQAKQRKDTLWVAIKGVWEWLNLPFISWIDQIMQHFEFKCKLADLFIWLHIHIHPFIYKHREAPPSTWAAMRVIQQNSTNAGKTRPTVCQMFQKGGFYFK